MTRNLFPLLTVAILAVTAADAVGADKLTYEVDIKPILREHCFACHSQDDATAGLALDSFEGLTTGGAGGEVVVAGDPDGSRLWKLVTHQEEPKMPPGDKLPQQQLDTLKAWIVGGLLRDANSKPMKRKQAAIARIDPSKLGQPVGEAAMPTQLLHEPVLWTAKPGPVESLATSPWAPVAAIAWQRQVSFYNTNTHELLGIVPHIEGVPQVVKFSRDGSLLLVAGGQHSAAGSATLIDVKTGARLAKLGDELDIVLAADISPDLALVAVGGPKKKVRVYRVADGELVYQINKHTDWVTDLSFSPDGKLLATADRGGGALLWQASAGHERADLRGHKAAITSVDWRADAAMLATASEDGTVRLWNPAGNQIKSINAHGGGVLSVRFAKDGNWVTTGRDHHVRTWKPDGAAIADLGKMASMTLAAAFSHDGKKVIASDYSGEVRVIDTSSKQTTSTLLPNPPHLAQRMATAEAALKSAQQKVDAETTDVKNRLAALENGKAAHAVHETKLAQAQMELEASRKRLDELAKTHTEKRQLADEARKAYETHTANVAAATTAIEQAKSQATEESQPDELAPLQTKLESALAAHADAENRLNDAKQHLKTAADGQQAGEKSVQTAEGLLATVNNETKGLPDLNKLTEQHAAAKSQLENSQKSFSSAEAAKTKIAGQQQRFANAMSHFNDQIQKRQTQHQELAKQSGRLEAEHQHAANQLSTHRVELDALSKQLTDLQAKLTELKSTDAKLQEQAKQRAAELAKVQAALTKSTQQTETLEQSKKDFESAQALRERYSSRDK